MAILPLPHSVESRSGVAKCSLAFSSLPALRRLDLRHALRRTLRPSDGRCARASQLASQHPIEDQSQCWLFVRGEQRPYESPDMGFRGSPRRSDRQCWLCCVRNHPGQAADLDFLCPRPPTMRTSSQWSKVPPSPSRHATPRSDVRGTPSEGGRSPRRRGRHYARQQGRQS